MKWCVVGGRYSWWYTLAAWQSEICVVCGVQIFFWELVEDQLRSSFVAKILQDLFPNWISMTPFYSRMFFSSACWHLNQAGPEWRRMRCFTLLCQLSVSGWQGKKNLPKPITRALPFRTAAFPSDVLSTPRFRSELHRGDAHQHTDTTHHNLGNAWEING